jgi:hypothetical protein
MSKSRRHFMQAAGMTLLASSAFPAFSQSELKAEVKKTFDPDNLTLLDSGSKELYERYLGLKFSVSVDTKPVGSMTLIEVKDLPVTKPPAGYVPAQEVTGYSLRFRGYGTPLPQDVYTLHNPSLGSVSLLLVPSGLPGSSTTYSAIVARLAP